MFETNLTIQINNLECNLLQNCAFHFRRNKMQFNKAKRVCSDSKTSPLKVVSPIIRKYHGHRQKRKKYSFDLETDSSTTQSNFSLRPILPKFTDGEPVFIEPELLTAVSSSTSFSVANTNIADDILQPVQEICRLAAGERKICSDKAARSRKRALSSSAKKKLQKYGKMIESALEIFCSETEKDIRVKDDAYTENYFLKLKNILSANEFGQFCTILEEIETMSPNVFKEISTLLAPYPDLLQAFLPFLSPAQARECGVFMDRLSTTKMTEFLGLLDVYFAKTPYQKKKILMTIEKLMAQPKLDAKELLSNILPMLKGHSVLTDLFLELLPSSRPPDFLRTDFDELDEEVLSDGSEDAGETWERTQLPIVPDLYGDKTCICNCHDSEIEKLRTRTQHCIPCSTKYINGKVFIQSGKLLRRATITFSDHDPEYHRNRLFPGLEEPRKRKRSSSNNKESTSPLKTLQISSDEFKSDDDDKVKTSTRLKRWKKPLKSKEEEKSVSDPVTEPVKDAEINRAKEQICSEEFKEKKISPNENIDIVEVTANRKSPPVISIPDNEIPGAMSPFLDALEELTVKQETNDNESAENEMVPWKMEEDKVILQTLQVEQYCEETFVKISEQLPARTVEDIKSRFQALLNILYKMKAESNDS